ncbi:sugar ABC transporter substrate-binding protein [Rubrobacter taiwanensis]|uniref:Sugar ABC transporter substrate-binding protein n=1 Tax=Rubrobacter taiwanensis TaxID=185139 RepID=A0A4R1BER7_9ACTN|nr:sugar ABC transporter substrate-binding protein [Rubrobacter taiwanensis]
MGRDEASRLSRREFLTRSACLTAALGVFGPLSGCGTGQQEAEQGPGEEFTGALSVLMGSHMEPVREVARMYEGEYGVEPQIEEVTTPDLRSKVTTAFLARRSPWDSVFLTAELGAEVADKGWLVEATEMIGRVREQGTLVERSLGAATYEGTIYAVPWTIGCPILHWNKRLLADAGLDPEAPAEWHRTPNSWDTMVEFAREVTDVDRNIYGLTDAWAGTHVLWTWGSLLQMHGGSFLDEDGQPAMNSEAGIAATEKLVDLLHTHEVIDPAVTTYTWVFDASPGFLNGNRAFFITWPFIADLASSAEDSNIAGENGFAPNPAVETSASVDGSEYFAVPVYSENEDEGWRFIELLSSLEGQRVVAESGWAPIHAELLEDEALLERFPFYAAIRQSYEYPVDGGWSPDRPVWAEILANQISEALGRQKSPREAMDDAVRRIRERREEGQ